MVNVDFFKLTKRRAVAQGLETLNNYLYRITLGTIVDIREYYNNSFFSEACLHNRNVS